MTTTPSESFPGDAGKAQNPGKAHTLLAAAATFVVVLDLAGVVILLPSVQAELGATIAEATWVVSVFVIAAATAIPLGGRLASMLGARRLLLVGIAVFGLASITAALSPAIPMLLIARTIQGFGAALVEPAVRGLLPLIRDRKRAERSQAVAAMLAAALGPVLPAALATLLSWRFQFWLGALLCAAILVAAVRRVPVGPGPDRRPLRVSDLLITSLGLVAAAAAFFAVIENPRLGWTSLPIVGATIIAAAGFAVLVFVERRRRDPLVRFVLFRHRAFTVGNSVRAITEFTSLGVFFPLSGFLQDQLGHSPIVAGLLLLPIILGALFTAPIAERFGDRFDLRWFLIPGFVTTAIGIYWIAHVTPNTPWWFFLAPLAVVGAGIGALENPGDQAIQRGTPGNATEEAWRLSRTIYLWGIGVGVAVVSATWQFAGTDTAGGVNTALTVCAIAAVVGALVAVLLPRHQHR